MKKKRLSSVPNWLKSGKLNVGNPRIGALPIAPKSMWHADLAPAHGG